MEQFVGLDVSQEVTHLCVVDSKGAICWQGKCASTPEAIAETIRTKAPSAVRIGLESGALSTWHWHALNGLGLPVICLDARHAKGSLGEQIQALDAQVRQYAAQSKVCRHLMTIPGVGPLTAVAFVTTVDDPGRFRKSSSVGAYLGLTPRRYQSGEIDQNGSISKCGDSLTRYYLFEAANVLLTRVQKWSALKAWGMRLAKRGGLKKAKVAVARKLAVIMHRMWVEAKPSAGRRPRQRPPRSMRKVEGKEITKSVL